MVLGFTSKLPDDRIPRNFQRILKEHEIKSLEIRDGFPVSTEAEKLAGRKAYQIFTFLCIAAAVICGMIDYMMTDGLNWFWFAAVGCACAWTIVSVAYTKRRNILKNEMWQLLLVTVLSIIWDHLTGWRGWSLDFIFPFGALAVLISMLVIAKVNRLEQEEYLFYLVQASVAGCIPGTARLARTDTHRLSVGCLRRDQHSGARCAVHFSEERYFGGVPEETADVSLSFTGHGMGTDEGHQ